MVMFRNSSKSVASALDRLSALAGAAPPYLRWAGGADHDVQPATTDRRWTTPSLFPRGGRRRRAPWRAIPASVVCAALAASDAFAIALAGVLALLVYADPAYI